jgi:hypothetical protein
VKSGLANYPSGVASPWPVIFDLGHLHSFPTSCSRTLDGVCASEGDVRYWNTGSWVYDPPRGSRAARECYVRRAWPGTAVLVDTDREAPQLVRMLGCRAQPKRSHGHGLALP